MKDGWVQQEYVDGRNLLYVVKWRAKDPKYSSYGWMVWQHGQLRWWLNRTLPKNWEFM